MTVVEKVAYTVVSNNADAETAPNWQSGSSYTRGTRVKYQDKIYTCAVPNSSTIPPNQNINEWVDTGNPNPTKFQDGIINTQTKKSSGNLEITIDIQNGFANTFAFFNVDAKAIKIYNQNNELIFDKAMTMREAVSNWWQYFYGGGFSFKSDTWFLSPLDYKGQVKFVIEPNEKGANLGHLAIGKRISIGHTLWEPKISTLNYSKKITDEWGNTYIRQGKTAKYADIAAVVPTRSVDFVKRTLDKNSGEMTLFIGDERDNGFECLTVFGVLKEPEIVLSNSQYCEMNISLEGVI